MKINALISILSGLMLLSLSCKASGEEVEAATLFSLKNQIGHKMTAPFFVTQEIGKHEVVVRFHVRNDFTVVIEDLECDDPRLRSHVIKSLSQQKFYIDKDKVNKSYSIRIVFS